MKRKYIDRFFLKMESRNNIYREQDIIQLRNLANSKNPEVRIRVAELLCTCEQDFVEKILFNMTFDKDELVRTHAVDSLGVGSQIESLGRLRTLMESEKSWLVRFYAVLSYVDVYSNIYDLKLKKKELVTELEALLNKEKEKHVKISYYEVLYCLENRRYIDELMFLLNESIDKNNGTLTWHILHSLENILDNGMDSKCIDYLKKIELRLNDAQKKYFQTVLKSKFLFDNM